ncbi:MAG TPA: formate dehydrogenase accessory protein FdhE [Paenalcaligenes sp.]|nr:formate dehydrogenase accessory protein FdhE [Paenalcaligenes sp.]
MAKSSESVVRILPAEEIITRGSGEPDPFIWPNRASLFAERSMRLKQLARQPGSISAYLGLMAELVQAQHQALADLPQVPLPDEDALAQAATHGLPPLAALDWQRDPVWQKVLHQLLDYLLDAEMRGEQADNIRQLLQRIKDMPAVELEVQADQLLAGSVSGVDLAAAPFIAAALQVYWTHMVCSSAALRTDEQYQKMNLSEQTTCPCCGSLPTTSMVHSFGGMAGQRYVACSLCGLQWHMPRIRCTRCLHEDGVEYMSLMSPDADEDDYQTPAVMAETCPECKTYLKIIHTEREPFAEPIADELANIQLDVLMGEGEYYKHGINLLLLFAQDPNASVDESVQATSS